MKRLSIQCSAPTLTLPRSIRGGEIALTLALARSTGRGNKSAGFTLVELVICLVIMVIFTAIAVPRYAQSIAHWRVETAARRMAADLTWARAIARTQSASQSVVFSTANSTYTLSGVSNPDEPSQTYSVNLNGNPYDATLTSVSFGGSSTLTFDGFGSPSSSGTAVLTCGSATKTITVNADDGAVSVQ